MYKKPLVGTAPDYSKRRNWLSWPKTPDKEVDLLYLYPSSCEDPLADTICSLNNPSMHLGAKRNFAQQASAFEPVANLFAPYWRQVNGMKLSKMSFEEVDQAEWLEPRTDVSKVASVVAEPEANGIYCSLNVVPLILSPYTFICSLSAKLSSAISKRMPL